MAPRPIARTDLHVRLPVAGHEALVAYADREGVSLNTALWLLVRRGLEREGIPLTIAPRPESATPPVADLALASAAVELVERALEDVEAETRPTTVPIPSPPPPRPGRRRRRRR